MQFNRGLPVDRDGKDPIRPDPDGPELRNEPEDFTDDKVLRGLHLDGLATRARRP